MQIYTFEHEGIIRVGVMAGGQLADLRLGSKLLIERQGPFEGIAHPLPTDALGLIRAGDKAWRFAEATVAFCSRRMALPIGERLLYSFEEVTILSPLLRPPKIICASAATSADQAKFSVKLATAIIGAEGVIRAETPLEVHPHLGFVLGRRIPRGRWHDVNSPVFGVTLLNDVRIAGSGADDLLSNNCDGFAPLGPSIRAVSSMQGDDLELSIRTDSNQSRVKFRNPIEHAAQVIERLSSSLTLEAGDIIALAASVSAFTAAPGDEISIETAAIGRLVNAIE